MSLDRINRSASFLNTLVATYLGKRGSKRPHMSRASTHVTQAASALMRSRDGIAATRNSKDTAASVSPRDARVWFERLWPPAKRTSSRCG